MSCLLTQREHYVQTRLQVSSDSRGLGPCYILPCTLYSVETISFLYVCKICFCVCIRMCKVIYCNLSTIADCSLVQVNDTKYTIPQLKTGPSLTLTHTNTFIYVYIHKKMNILSYSKLIPENLTIYMKT